MWNEGDSVEATVYNGTNLVEATALIKYINKAIELKTHIPFPGEQHKGKYLIPTSAQLTPYRAGFIQIVMKGVIKEEENNEK